MKMRICLIKTIAAAGFLSISSSYAQNANLSGSFKAIERIKLSDRVVVGEVSHLDVDNWGNYLVTDCIAKRVYIFTANGDLKAELKPDSCFPGFNMAPLKATYKRDNTVLLLNSVPWGFRFDNEGQCIGGMNKDFTAPINVAFGSNGRMVGYYLGRSSNEGSYLCMMDSVGKELFRFGAFPKEFHNLLGRIEGGGVAIDPRGFIYNANPVEPLIYKYNDRGKLVAKFGTSPPRFSKVERDISDSRAPGAILSEFAKIMKGKGTVISLHLLNDSSIVVQYSYSMKRYGMQVYRLNGHLLNREEIVTDSPVALAKGNRIYIVRQPEPDKSGNLPNPLIEVYISLL